MAKVASSAATARSHDATSWQPAAVARACTLATTGWGIAWTAFIMSVQTWNKALVSESDAPRMSAKLWPAENTGPFAARITPNASVAPTSANAAVSSVMTSSARALRFSGRLRVTVTIVSSRFTSRCWYPMAEA
jgi:hypothetical protein